MREIVLDTETTGLDPSDDHRIVEIACLELANHLPTGRFFHRYVNPERAMPAEALAVHGLTDEFLAAHPNFAVIADELVSFIADARLVIHNAEFDLGFLNAELRRLERAPLDCAFTDTLSLARRRYPGAPASLDALCRRFAIDLSARAKHGAKLDCELLAAVYLELIGGRQPGLDLAASLESEARQRILNRPVRPARPHAPNAAEAAAHAAFLAKLKAPLWLVADGPPAPEE
ncbi:MAG TPA: DNA polymerase III subunit epsilon [Stellaceae bacterium]|nr:DNA polymerase III subunit epsilon [Stellaceae bacterium]